MGSAFDPRIVPAGVVRFLRSVQRRAAGKLAGGGALAGLHLRHRLSRDVDAAFGALSDVRAVVADLAEIARESGASVRVIRDGGAHVRAEITTSEGARDLDLYVDASPEIAPSDVVEGVRVESYADLRASKLARLPSRSEARDLVDVLAMERAGARVEDDLPLALRKDAGVCPLTVG